MAFHVCEKKNGGHKSHLTACTIGVDRFYPNILARETFDIVPGQFIKVYYDPENDIVGFEIIPKRLADENSTKIGVDCGVRHLRLIEDKLFKHKLTDVRGTYKLYKEPDSCLLKMDLKKKL